MNGKKISWFHFHFPELLGNFHKLKQDFFFLYLDLRENPILGKQIDRTQNIYIESCIFCSCAKNLKKKRNPGDKLKKNPCLQDLKFFYGLKQKLINQDFDFQKSRCRFKDRRLTDPETAAFNSISLLLPGQSKILSQLLDK